MLSVTTTALSTSRPIASSMPIIVRMLSEKPRKYIAATVIRSEKGTASATISVVGQWRRNRNSTTRARPAPIRPAFRSSVEGAADILGLVLQHDDVDALQLRELALLFDDRHDAVGDVDDVRAGRLEHVEADARPAVQVATRRSVRA